MAELRNSEQDAVHIACCEAPDKKVHTTSVRDQTQAVSKERNKSKRTSWQWASSIICHTFIAPSADKISDAQSTTADIKSLVILLSTRSSERERGREERSPLQKEKGREEH